MSYMIVDLTEMMTSNLLKEAVPNLFAFYQSPQVGKLLRLMEQHETQHRNVIQNLTLQPSLKKVKCDPYRLLLLQELIRPAALILQGLSDYHTLPAIYKNATSAIDPAKEAQFLQDVNKKAGRTYKELEIAGLLYLAKVIKQYGLDFAAYEDPREESATQYTRLKSDFIQTVREPLCFDVMEALYALPPFTKASEARLKLRSIEDESFCVYAAVKYIVINQALLIFHAALKEEALERRNDAINKASPQLKPSLLKEKHTAQIEIDDKIRRKLTVIIHAAREHGWESIDYQELTNLKFVSPGTQSRVLEQINILRSTDALEMDYRLSGFEAAIKLEQQTPHLHSIARSPSKPSDLAKAYSPKMKQAGYFWQLTHDLQAYDEKSLSPFRRILFICSPKQRAFHASKQAVMQQIVTEVGETLHPDRAAADEDLQQKVRRIQTLIQTHLTRIQQNEIENNWFRKLPIYGETTMVGILKNALDYLQKTAQLEDAPAPFIPRSPSH